MTEVCYRGMEMIGRVTERSFIHPIFGRCYLNRRGYWRIATRGKFRGKYLHRVLFELMAQRHILEGYQIHHQNFNKQCFCPHNLIELPAVMNPNPVQHRDPYTGRWIDNAEYVSKYGRYSYENDVNVAEQIEEKVPF